MPNPLIYASTTPDHSLHKGGVAVGVNSVEYNSSSGWVNGAIPTDWDYVIYKTTSGANPNIFAPANEQEFYNFVLMQGGSASDTTSVEAALAWIATQSDLLAFHSSFPNIVTDGLVLALNAGDVSSYPTTGTTWYDLSGQGNDGTLINGPTFNNGTIFFDAADDRVHTSQGALDNNASYSVLLKSYGRANDYNMYMGQYLPYMGVYQGDRIVYSDYINGNQSWFTTPSGTIISNKWYNIVCTRVYNGSSTDMKIYINGVVISSTNNSGQKTPFSSPDTIAIGDGAHFTWYPYYGEIASAQVYNKTLTQSEVLQNYYQAPIVTDGLVFAVDAGNLVSYENGDTTTYSMTGSSTGTLTNGVGFDSANGGYWDFDGTNDYISMGSLNLQQSWTLEVWANMDDASSFGLFGQGVYSGNSGLHILYQSSARGMIFGMYANDNDYMNNYRPLTGIWYHWVFTYNASTYNKQFYADSVLQTPAASVENVYSGTGQLNIGAIYSSAISPANGKIGATRFYNRVLTAEEVQQNFQAQSSRFI